MDLIANCQLTGDYGTVVEGDFFTVDASVGASLIQRGLARPANPPRIFYDTKVIQPEAPEVRPRLPFRDLSLCDPESSQLAPASHSVFPGAELPSDETRITHHRGRPRRTRSIAE